MRQVVYVDILLCVNLFINYFILFAVMRFLSLSAKRLRLVMAASLGALYSLCILLPELSILTSLGVKIIMAFTIVTVAFGIVSLKQAVRLVACFFVISFLFAGIMFFIWHNVCLPGLIVKNGMVYFNISPLFLIISTLISYLIMSAYDRIAGNKKIEDCHCEILVHFHGRQVRLKAKVDTGNSLREPFSNLPVVVTSYHSIKEIAPEHIHRYLKASNLTHSTESDTSTGPVCLSLRMIPFNAVNGRGLLPAFKAEYVTIISHGRSQKKEAYIAVCKDALTDEDFCALINPDLL